MLGEFEEMKQWKKTRLVLGSGSEGNERKEARLLALAWVSVSAIWVKR